MFKHMKEFTTSLMARWAILRDEEGQTLVEYSLILALVSIAAIVALEGLTGGITGALGTVEKALEK
jgi:Flp pilus assembly pilin Flp